MQLTKGIRYMCSESSPCGTIQKGDVFWLGVFGTLVNPRAGGWLGEDEYKDIQCKYFAMGDFENGEGI